MGKVIQKIPIPIAGLMLGMAALGNLLGVYGSAYRNIFGLLAGVIFVLLVSKFVTTPQCLREGFDNPVVASVTPTFSMGIMLLSTYLLPYTYSVAYGLWLFGVLLHIGLIAYFTKRYIVGFNIKKVFPSYFIVYVGIVVASVTAPAYNLLALGQVLFWFGFAANLVLLPIVFYRFFIIKEIPEAALPTTIIFAAPTSLCLAGYLNSFPEKNMAVLGFLVSLSLLLIVFSLSYLPKLLKLQFYPSYSAFTFPIVISAIGIKGANAAFMAGGLQLPLLVHVATFLEVVAVLLVVYVFARYIGHLLPLRQVATQQVPITSPKTNS
ncbi:TDT family transporter [Dethiobacter alkaliphilus]|uniref:TDT family transporter n=1 Tax=Dethiobacter alkaliphilus TaxID=427926 RepID=UPI002226F080|nr:TDT family transporter [Dethiobacter alkaliphilus]MCW3488505.1 TDT family transporter [Dethiobacter alkaliphilus]